MKDVSDLQAVQEFLETNRSKIDDAVQFEIAENISAHQDSRELEAIVARVEKDLRDPELPESVKVELRQALELLNQLLEASKFLQFPLHPLTEPLT